MQQLLSSFPVMYSMLCYMIFANAPADASTMVKLWDAATALGVGAILLGVLIKFWLMMEKKREDVASQRIKEKDEIIARLWKERDENQKKYENLLNKYHNQDTVG